ncbi:gliding motility protein [Streptomyces nodosus]|uniref:gliding motility protein n=1 Tax=Streptomyces nodosus TaxID=40318 RepID=UPI0036E74524
MSAEAEATRTTAPAEPEAADEAKDTPEAGPGAAKAEPPRPVGGIGIPEQPSADRAADSEADAGART